MLVGYMKIASFGRSRANRPTVQKQPPKTITSNTTTHMKTLKHLLFALLAVTTFSLASCKKDKCKDKTCQNGGACADGTCNCAAGYTGENCETEIRAKFRSTYNVNESCPSGNFTYQITISNSSAGVDRLLISNFGGYGASVSATASGSTLTVATQQVDLNGTSATFSGTGQLSGNILTISYTISGGGSSESCTMNCTKV